MIGFDTETENGRAVLLAAVPTEGPARILDVASLGPGRAIQAIHEFCLSLDSQCVGWNVDYDARAILAYAPRRWLWRLARVSRGVWPGTTMSVRYIPGKVFELASRARRFRLYDAQQFFGGSLASRAALVGMEKGDPGVSWRAIGPALRRGGARAARVREYCVHDARIAARLWAHAEKSLQGLGVDCSIPYSPAALAARYFIPTPRPIAAYAQERGEAAYYGGRSEIFRRGRLRDVRNYDIHSAYPWALAQMPAWETQVPYRALDFANFAVVTADLLIPETVPIGPVPVRHRGVLVYPTGAIPNYTMDLHTFRVVERAGYVQRVREITAWRTDPFERPRLAFPDIPRLYDLKERDADLRLAAKLMLNGLSGKLAEIREMWVDTDWLDADDTLPDGSPMRRTLRLATRTNFVMAAHCTGHIRARLWESMMTDPDAIIGCATDGIFAARDLPLDVGPDLGRWGREVIRDHIQIASGMYLHGELQTLRGFATKDPVLEKLRRAGTKSAITVRCGLPTTLLHSLRAAEQINLIGTWPRKLDLNCDMKRRWPAPVTARDLLFTARAQASAPLKMEDLCQRKNSLKTRKATKTSKPRRAKRRTHRL